MSGQRKHAFEVKWRIENARSWLRTREDSLYSPQFLSETLANTRWKLRLSRKWQAEEKCICLALERDADDHPKSVVLNYELTFLAHDGSALISESHTTKFALNTVSPVLKVRGVEIFGEKKEAYFLEGVLTVGCKLWTTWSTISRGGQCLLRSVIGKKCVTLDGAIDYFSRLAKNYKETVYFLSPSEISFIAFDVHVSESGSLVFDRVEVECEHLNIYSCELCTLDESGKKIVLLDGMKLALLLNSHEICRFHIIYNCDDDYHRFLRNNTLKLQLDLTFYPGIESEFIEYDENKGKALIDESTNLENMSASNSAIVQSLPLHLSEHVDKTRNSKKNESGDEDECFKAENKMHLPPTTTLGEDLRSLYNDRLFCDTKLQTDTETFPAHRNVLSARSPVFKKMFTTDMKEKAGECINVPDLSSDTVRRMLQFLYTDCTGDLDMQSAKDLYIASDKYDITSLKQLCSSFIKENLCPANVCEVIVLADMHQDKDLESVAHEFVLTYDEEVLGSDEWKLFMKNFTSLAAQVMYLKCMKK